METSPGGTTEPEQDARSYDSLIQYLREDGDKYIVERAREVSKIIENVLETDHNDTLKGVLDDSFLAEQKLGHLAFIVNSKPKDLLELDGLSLTGGTKLEEVIYDDEEVVAALRAGQVKDEAEAKARRALIMLAACRAIIKDRQALFAQEQNCA